MRQAHSSNTNVSQLWYMMLHTCTTGKHRPFSVSRAAVVGDAGPHHHGDESTDVALLHDHPPQQTKGAFPGWVTGGSCQEQWHREETVPLSELVCPKLVGVVYRMRCEEQNKNNQIFLYNPVKSQWWPGLSEDTCWRHNECCERNSGLQLHKATREQLKKVP